MQAKKGRRYIETRTHTQTQRVSGGEEFPTHLSPYKTHQNVFKLCFASGQQELQEKPHAAHWPQTKAHTHMRTHIADTPFSIGHRLKSGRKKEKVYINIYTPKGEGDLTYLCLKENQSPNQMATMSLCRTHRRLGTYT